MYSSINVCILVLHRLSFSEALIGPSVRTSVPIGPRRLAWHHPCCPTHWQPHRKGEVDRCSGLPHGPLPNAPDGPLSLLALNRGQWAIEKSLHYVRDVTFAEDRSRLRTGHAPQLLAACRNLAMTLLHRSGSSRSAATRRSFSYHPRRAFVLLFARPSPQP